VRVCRCSLVVFVAFLPFAISSASLLVIKYGPVYYFLNAPYTSFYNRIQHNFFSLWHRWIRASFWCL
jgi:hypothetical protein